MNWLTHVMGEILVIQIGIIASLGLNMVVLFQARMIVRMSKQIKCCEEEDELQVEARPFSWEEAQSEATVPVYRHQ